MEFKEFSNPEERDYDINSSNYTQDRISSSNNNYSYQLAELIGILEDVTEEELQSQYGISLNEYFKPNAETIAKVTQNIQKAKHR